MPSARPQSLPRLVDLAVDWLLQYAGEATTFDPAPYAEIRPRLGQVDGYLQATAAAVVLCRRRPDDRAGLPDRWHALGELVARVEAEFSGRLLIAPADVDRWRDDPDGLTWAALAVGGLDTLILGPDDLDRLATLFDRGVRFFRLSDAGAGLTDLGRGALTALAALGGQGPTPVVDLAGLDASGLADALAWFEADPDRPRRLAIVRAGGAPLSGDELTRLRALGGVLGFPVGPPDVDAPATLRAAIESAAAVPFRGRVGFEGIAVATGFLGSGPALPGLGNAEQVAGWLAANFDRPTAWMLIQENAARLLERAAGIEPSGQEPA